jgi:hypothetical protein
MYKNIVEKSSTYITLAVIQLQGPEYDQIRQRIDDLHEAKRP